MAIVSIVEMNVAFSVVVYFFHQLIGSVNTLTILGTQVFQHPLRQGVENRTEFSCPWGVSGWTIPRRNVLCDRQLLLTQGEEALGWCSLGCSCLTCLPIAHQRDVVTSTPSCFRVDIHAQTRQHTHRRFSQLWKFCEKSNKISSTLSQMWIRLNCLHPHLAFTNTPTDTPTFAHALQGRHEKAVIYFQRALKLNRAYLSAWTLMGHECVFPHVAITKCCGHLLLVCHVHVLSSAARNSEMQKSSLRIASSQVMWIRALQFYTWTIEPSYINLYKGFFSMLGWSSFMCSGYCLILSHVYQEYDTYWSCKWFILGHV